MLQYPPLATNERLRRAAANAPWMARGERGVAVAILQGALIDTGLRMPLSTRKTGIPDGIYGLETQATVLAFQTHQKLRGKDGIAGRETLQRLDRLMLPKGQKSATGKPPVPPPPADRHYRTGTADPSIQPDPGAGAWKSTPPTMLMQVFKQAILEILPPQGSSAAVAIGDDAARHMKHYLDNTGNPLAIDLVGMISEVKTARARFLHELSQAQAFTETLPGGTHSITSVAAEGAYNRKSESTNWFFAIGGYSTWGKGVARVVEGGGRRYELDFEYRFFDRYNWDAGKSVTIGPVTVTDEFMGEFHRQGLAREYDCVGSISRTLRWAQGETIPADQLLPKGGR